MADNYLEKRYDEVFGTGKTRVKRVGITLDELILRNRSTRGFNKQYVVKRSELERIVSVANKVPSARNAQVLRYRLVTRDSGADRVLPLLKMGAALPELHLPLAGTEPEAFIVVCSVVDENPMVDIDLGIAAQTMLLKATEMGFRGLIVVAFDRGKLQDALHLPCRPVMVIAIGKGIEDVRLKWIGEGESHAYYREEGVHYVPKLRMENLLLPDAE